METVGKTFSISLAWVINVSDFNPYKLDGRAITSFAVKFISHEI